MKNIKQYGDLTDKGLYELLAEIKSDDEDIESAQSEAEVTITLQEQENREIEAQYGDKMPWVGVGANNCQGVRLYGPEGLRKAITASKDARRLKSQYLKEERLRIQREAFNQDIINLSDAIGRENIKALISLLVKEHAKMADKYSALINKRLTALLTPLIPRRLKICENLYPDSIRKCPGFIYQASKEYGAGLSFWAQPDIPYYFAQGTEQQAIINCKPQLLISVDQFVKLYHEHINKKAEKELKYASVIYAKDISTYFDLLKANPFWYNRLYNYLTGHGN